MPLLLLLSSMAGAVEPCYGWTLPSVVEGPRVSVEYDDLIDEDGALRILDATEAAWTTYTKLGFEAPNGSPSILIDTDPLGRGGFAQTEPCGDTFHPKLFVYSGALALDGGRPVAVHELFHAVQYAYDTRFSFAEHFAIWPWWSEGTATWAESLAVPDDRSRFRSLSDHFFLGHLALHQDLTALVDPDRSDFLYSTAVVAYSLVEDHGAEAISRTFEVGAKTPNTPAWFPDVLTAIDVDFDAFWANHLARLPSVDYDFGSELDVQPPVVSTIDTVPFVAVADKETPPQGLGWAIHRIRPSGLDEGAPLRLRFAGVDPARWHVVVVTARRNRPGSPATLAFSGIADGTNALESTVDYANPMWVVVSPEIDSSEGLAYTIDVDSDTPLVEEVGCEGCTNSSQVPLGVWPGLALLLLHRRRR